MQNQKKYLRIFLFTLFLLAISSTKLLALEFSSAEAEKIAKLIFQNECAGKDIHLVAWNEGEDFPSLGIGHFIWYPKDKRGPYDESFVSLLEFVEQKGVPLPPWLADTQNRHAPWPDRETFLKNSGDQKNQELRKFLRETISYQALFMIKRLNQALDKIGLTAPPELRPHIRQKFLAVAVSQNGIYALVDYINFKGEGVLPSERYQDRGWGLLQVLEEMNLITNSTDDPVQEFSRAAKKTLERRANNSSFWGYERKWLKGWQKRIDTYLTASLIETEDASLAKSFDLAQLGDSEEILALQALAIS